MIDGVFEKYSPEKLRRYIQALAASSPNAIKIGVVKTVDPLQLTCVIEPESAPKDAQGLPILLTDVDLGLATSQPGFGIYQLPKVGCQVTYLASSPIGPYCLAFAEVDSYLINAKVVINAGTNGDMINWLNLQAQLNKLLAQLAAVVTTLQTWVPVSGDGGAALKAAFATAIAGHPAADFSGTNLTDPNVKH